MKDVDIPPEGAAGAGVAGAAGGLCVDVTLAAHTAGRLLDGAFALADETASLLSDLDVEARSLGPFAGAGQLLRAHQHCVDDVAEVLESLAQILEGDADRFYQLAFAADEVDADAAIRLGRTGGGNGRAGFGRDGR